MSPNQVFPLDSAPLNPIAARVLRDPNLIYDVTADSIVIAVKRELLVLRSIRRASPRLDQALSGIAANRGTLAAAGRGKDAEDSDRDVEHGTMADIEVWRLDESKVNAGVNSIDVARRLRVLAEDEKVATGKGPALALPAVSPHHVGILSPAAGGCPAGPAPPCAVPARTVRTPSPRRPDRAGHGPGQRLHLHRTIPMNRIGRSMSASRWSTANGWTRPPIRRRGYPTVRTPWTLMAMGGSTGSPVTARSSPGLIAHACPEVRLTVVGLRNQEVEIDGN